MTLNLYPIIIQDKVEVSGRNGLENMTMAIRAYWINDIADLYRPAQFFIFTGSKQVGLGYITPHRYFQEDHSC